MSSTCFEQPSVHPQEDLYIHFLGTSFMHPYEQSGWWQAHKHSSTSCHRPDYSYGCTKEVPRNWMYKSSWGWTLGCSKHVEDTIIKLQHWCKRYAFCWFLLHRNLTILCQKAIDQLIVFSFHRSVFELCSVIFQYTHRCTVRNKKQTVNVAHGITNDVLLCTCANGPTFLSVLGCDLVQHQGSFICWDISWGTFCYHSFG